MRGIAVAAGGRVRVAGSAPVCAVSIILAWHVVVGVLILGLALGARSLRVRDGGVVVILAVAVVRHGGGFLVGVGLRACECSWGGLESLESGS